MFMSRFKLRGVLDVRNQTNPNLAGRAGCPLSALLNQEFNRLCDARLELIRISGFARSGIGEANLQSRRHSTHECEGLPRPQGPREKIWVNEDFDPHYVIDIRAAPKLNSEI
jgi:hypothetical protein